MAVQDPYPQYADERYWYLFDFGPILEDLEDEVSPSGTSVSVPAQLTVHETRVDKRIVYCLISLDAAAVTDTEYLAVCNAVTQGGQEPSLAIEIVKRAPSYNTLGQLPQESYWHYFNFKIPLEVIGDYIIDTGTDVTLPAELLEIETYIDGMGVWCKIEAAPAAPYDTPYVVKCHARTKFGQRVELYEAVTIIDPATLGG